jgi:replicative DNA helicase
MENLEQQILKDIFTQDEFLAQAGLITELNKDDFKDQDSKEMYVCFSDILIKRQMIDSISVYETDKELGLRCLKFTEGGKSIIREAHIHVKMLKERNYREEVKAKAKKLVMELAKETDTDKFDEVKNKIIIQLSQTDLDIGSKFVNPKKVTALIIENMKKNAGLEGVSWGLADLDTYTSGIVTPRLIVLGGLKKTGKSRFVINTRQHLYRQQVPSVFLSLEMPEYEVTKLAYSRYAQIPDIHFKSNGFMSNEENARFEQAQKEIDWNLFPTECISGLSIHQVLQRIRIYARIYKNPIIFIDYLQRIKHNRDRQAQELEEISNALADATRTYGITIVLLSQLANSAEREELSIGHLKGSGGIGESADVILLLSNLYRKSKDEADKGKFEILIEQRYGDSGIIKCATDLGTCTFKDADFDDQQIRKASFAQNKIYRVG